MIEPKDIGGKLYPLGARRKEKRVFTHENTKRISDSDLEALMREVHKQRDFRSGYCYTTTTRVVMNALHNGWPKIQYFSGWLTISGGEPLHHAWAVLGDGVIDMTCLFASVALMKKFDENTKERAAAAKAAGGDTLIEWAVQWRREWIELIAPFEAGDIIENRVWGQVPEGYVYVGCPSDAKESVLLFNDWHARYGKGTDGPGEMSPTQVVEEALKKDGEEGVRKIIEKLKGERTA